MNRPLKFGELPVTKEKEETSVQESDFELLLKTVENKIKRDGEYSGLCEMCFNSGSLFLKKGKYWGVSCEATDEHFFEPIKCTHGEDIVNTSGL